MKPFCCPVCNGHGTTIRPPNVAGGIVTQLFVSSMHWHRHRVGAAVA